MIESSAGTRSRLLTPSSKSFTTRHILRSVATFMLLWSLSFKVTTHTQSSSYSDQRATDITITTLYTFKCLNYFQIFHLLLSYCQKAKLLIRLTRIDILSIIILYESNIDRSTYFNPQKEIVKHIKLLKPTGQVQVFWCDVQKNIHQRITIQIYMYLLLIS